jgi:hypothetical protein
VQDVDSTGKSTLGEGRILGATVRAWNEPSGNEQETSAHWQGIFYLIEDERMRKASDQLLVLGSQFVP